MLVAIFRSLHVIDRAVQTYNFSTTHDVKCFGIFPKGFGRPVAYVTQQGTGIAPEIFPNHFAMGINYIVSAEKGTSEERLSTAKSCCAK